MIPTLHSPENFKVGIQHMSFISNVAAVIKCDEAYTRLIFAADVFLCPFCVVTREIILSLRSTKESVHCNFPVLITAQFEHSRIIGGFKLFIISATRRLAFDDKEIYQGLKNHSASLPERREISGLHHFQLFT